MNENQYNDVDLLSLLNEDKAKKLGGDLEIAAETNPVQAARTDKLSRESGLPFDIVEGKEDEVERQNQYKSLDLKSLLNDSPTTASYLGNPNNAKQAHGDIRPLSDIERAMRGVADVPRAFGTEMVRFGGRALSGFGEMYDAANRIAAKGLYAITPGSVEDFMTQKHEGLQYVDPSYWLKREGDIIKRDADIIDVPQERKNFVTDVAGGLGQMTGQIFMTLANPPAALAAMYAQGADQMADRQDAMGVKGDDLGNDLAILNAAGWTALTERTGIDKILNRVPPQIKNKVMQKLADLAIAGGIEAVQEVVEGIGHNMIEYATFNPDAEIFEGLEHEASVAGTTGAIMRGIVMALAPGKASFSTRYDQERIERINKATENSALRANNPDAFRELVTEMGFNTETDEMYVNPEAANELFQSGVLPPEVEAIPSVQAMRADVAAAMEAGRDISIPMADYMTDIIGTEIQSSLAEHMKMGVDAMTPSELASLDVQADVDRIMEMDADQRIDSSEVYSDIVGQFVGMGWDQSTAESYGALHEAMFNTLGKRTGKSAKELYDRYGLTITRQAEKAVRDRLNSVDDLDLQLDRLRKGEMPSDNDIFGESIIPFIAKKGGIFDDGGELDSRDADVGKVGRNRLARKDGRTLDDVAEYLAEEGYIAERNPDLVLEAIDKELAGNAVYSMGKENNEKLTARDQLNELGEMLDRSGIDLQTMTNDQVKKAMMPPVDEQDFGDTEYAEDVEIVETGETVTMRQPAQRAFDQLVKRRDMVAKIGRCLNAS